MRKIILLTIGGIAGLLISSYIISRIKIKNKGIGMGEFKAYDIMSKEKIKKILIEKNDNYFVIKSDKYFPAIVEGKIENEKNKYDLHLVPKSEIFFKFLDDLGVPIVNKSIKIKNYKNEYVKFTDKYGIFKINDCFASISLGQSTKTIIDLDFYIEGFLQKKYTIEPNQETVWNYCLNFEPSVKIIGIVKNYEKNSIQNAVLVAKWNYKEITNQNGDVITKTNKDGLFEINVRKSCSDIQIIAYHADYPIGFAIFEDLNAIEDKDICIELEKGYEFEGIVLNENGEPVKDVTIDIDKENEITDWMRFSSLKYFNYVPDFTSTGEDGMFKFQRITAGKYKIYLNHDDYIQDFNNMDGCLVSVGDNRKIWCGILKLGFEVEGNVVLEDGTPVYDESVIFYKLDVNGRVIKGLSKGTRTSVNGYFKVKGLQEGVYDVLLSGQNVFPSERIKVDPLNKKEDLKIKLIKHKNYYKNGKINIVFVNEDLFAIENRLAFVSIYSNNLEKPEYTFLEKIKGGLLSRENLPEGELKLKIEIENYPPIILDNLKVNNVPTREIVELEKSHNLKVINNNLNDGIFKVICSKTGIIIYKINIHEIAEIKLNRGIYHWVFSSYDGSKISEGTIGLNDNEEISI